MNLSDLQSLDFSNTGNWPVAAKAGAITLFCLLVLGAGYWFDAKELLLILEQAKAKEQELKQEYAIKQAKAVNLEAYKQQLAGIEESLGEMLRQLPSQAEVADLLVDISQTGLASGLEFELFSPKEEVPQEFYAEMPIQIRVTGNYHEFGAFVSGTAALPRIVTLHDILIRHPAEKQDKLIMEVTAKTYRYLDEQEMSAAQGKNSGGTQ